MTRVHRSDRSVAEARFSEVFGELDFLSGYARRRGARDPDGIAAEVMAIAWRRLADVPTADARPWLIVTARNLLLAERRREPVTAGMIAATPPASGWRVSVQPEYYGLLAFADAAPAGSRLLRISDPGLPGFYQFAVRAPDRSERIVLTNVGSAARTIGVTASGAHGTGSVSLLTAKSLTATSGATLRGQSLLSRTGQLAGTPRRTLVRPNAKRVYAVRVPAHAAAILTLSG